jgi:prepilin-type N-terminal cleavage/methylation domain-containing protein
MKLKWNKLGFTLIELLVVITIVGILATWAIWVYTTQLQWARDSTRISDLSVLDSANHQYFSDNSEYPPESWYTWAVSDFVSKTLEDPKWIAVCYQAANDTGGLCEWRYEVWDDTNSLPNSAFKLWIRFEKEINYTKKAVDTNDWGNSSEFFEKYSWAWAPTLFDLDTSANNVRVY